MNPTIPRELIPGKKGGFPKKLHDGEARSGRAKGASATVVSG